MAAAEARPTSSADGERPPRGRRPGRPRLWKLFAPLLGDPRSPEAFDGEHILAEIQDDGAALLLWSTYRDALLWASAPADAKRRLFSHGWMARQRALIGAAELPVAPLLALNRLSAALREGGGGGAAAASESFELAGHFAGSGAVKTALAFTKLACAVQPHSPAVAVRAARLAARLRCVPLAESVLQRAIGLARRARDRRSYALAHVVLGEIREQEGDRAGAAGAYARAARVGRRAGVLDARRSAAAGLLRTELAAGRLEHAAAHARTALRLRGTDDPDYPRVALDAADVALRQGDAAEAARLAAGLTLADVPGDELRLLTIQMQAVGGADGNAGAERAWDAAAEILARRGESPDAARLLIVLAANVLETLGPARADALAVRALGIATRARDEPLAQECRAALVRIRERRRERSTAAT